MPSNGQKAFLETEAGKKLPCLFNPSELEISLGTTWQGSEQINETGVPELKYTGNSSGSMSLELFFDTTSTGKSVTTYTNDIIKLTAVDKSLPGYSAEKMNGRPPWVIFHWGKFHSFRAVVESLKITYVYFSSSGDPLRARVSLTLKQLDDKEKFPAQNPTSGTPLPQKSHQVLPGETLDRIAYRYYGDPTRWRAIAAANGVSDPFGLRPGQTLDIPVMES